MTVRRLKREFTEEFKLQMVKLYNSSKPKAEIVREYDLARLYFQHLDKTKLIRLDLQKKSNNRTPEETELIKIRKENQQLEMENDILKQAALIR